MTRIELKSRIGPDGVLHMPGDVAFDRADANEEVVITIEKVGNGHEGKPKPMSREEWLKFIDETAGSMPWLERPDDLPWTERDWSA